MNRISIGWGWLERTLNAIIEELNREKFLQSSTVAIEESPNGTILKVISIQNLSDSSAAPGGPAPPSGIYPHFPPPGYAHWYQVTARDGYDIHANPQNVTFLYFGTAPSPTKWP